MLRDTYTYTLAHPHKNYINICTCTRIIIMQIHTCIYTRMRTHSVCVCVWHQLANCLCVSIHLPITIQIMHNLKVHKPWDYDVGCMLCSILWLPMYIVANSPCQIEQPHHPLAIIIQWYSNRQQNMYSLGWSSNVDPLYQTFYRTDTF